MPIEPIKPGEVDAAKEIPEQVFRAFNELIAKNWDGHSSTVTQNDVVCRIKVLMSLDSAKQIFDNHWLDIESAYRKAGWKVEYDKPGYNETGEAVFQFEKKRK